MTNLENQSLEYHSYNHYYFRDSYIDMQKRCSRLNYELGLGVGYAAVSIYRVS